MIVYLKFITLWIWNQNSDFLFSILNCQQQVIVLGIASEDQYDLGKMEPLPAEWWKSGIPKLSFGIFKHPLVIYAKRNGTSQFLFLIFLHTALQSKRGTEWCLIIFRKLEIRKPFLDLHVQLCILGALIQAELRKTGHIIQHELPKEMLLQCRNWSPDLGNNLYAPAENRNQSVG